MDVPDLGDQRTPTVCPMVSASTQISAIDYLTSLIQKIISTVIYLVTFQFARSCFSFGTPTPLSYHSISREALRGEVPLGAPDPQLRRTHSGTTPQEFSEIAPLVRPLTTDDITAMALIVKGEAERGERSIANEPRIFTVPDSHGDVIMYCAFLRDLSEGRSQVIIQKHSDWVAQSHSNSLILELTTQAAGGDEALFTRVTQIRLGERTLENKAGDLNRLTAFEQLILDGLFTSAVPTKTEIARHEHYTHEVQIRTVKSIIARDASEQVQTLARQLSAVRSDLTIAEQPQLRVVFLTSQLQNALGMDDGGLSREYITNLFEGFWTNLDRKIEVTKRSPTEPQPWFVTPNKVVGDADGNFTLPRLTPGDASRYIAMGNVMKHVYDSDGLLTGVHGHDAMFAAILDLTGEELDGEPDCEVPLSAQIKILRHLAASDPDGATIRRMLNICSMNPHLLNEQEKGYAWAALEANEYECEMAVVGHEPHWTEAKKCMVSAAIQSFGREVDPIFRIAKGMAEACVVNQPVTSGPMIAQWNYFREHVAARPSLFAQRIQGTLDRDQIANSIVGYEGANISTPHSLASKVRWIKNWIRNPHTTDDAVKAFLNFTTGSTSLNPQQPPKINPVIGLGARPRAHTCDRFFDLDPAYADSVTSTGEILLRGNTEAEFIQIFTQTVFETAGFEDDQ